MQRLRLKSDETNKIPRLTNVNEVLVVVAGMKMARESIRSHLLSAVERFEYFECRCVCEKEMQKLKLKKTDS